VLTSKGALAWGTRPDRKLSPWTTLRKLLGMSSVHSGRMRTTETPISSPATLAGIAATTETQTAQGGRPTATIVPGERLVLTVAEAGELLGISRAFAYELVARGELPVIRLGRRIVVPKAALLAMVDLTPRPIESGTSCCPSARWSPGPRTTTWASWPRAKRSTTPDR
jgi:excisionase family DNA binding protein